MGKRFLILLVVFSITLVAAGCIAPAPPKPGKEVVKISVQPVYSLHVMSQKYSPLFKYLAKETGYDLRVVSAMSYDNYFPTLEANEVHIGIQNPLAYVTLAKTRGAYPLAKMVQPDGKTSYRGVIISGKDSEIDKLEDLRGKEVVAASRSPVAGFLAQALVCKQQGIDVDKELHLSFVGTQDAVIEAVYRGKAEAGFVREDALQLTGERIDLSRFNIIAETPYFPTWCVAAFDNTPSSVANRIANALLRLDISQPADRELLEAIGIAGFQKAVDADYDIIRKVITELNLPY